jgi:hypothetical protein
MKYSLKLQLLIMLFSAPTKSKKASKSIIFYLSETKLPIAFPLTQCLAFPQQLLSNNKPSFFKQQWASSHQEKQSQTFRCTNKKSTPLLTLLPAHSVVFSFGFVGAF